MTDQPSDPAQLGKPDVGAAVDKLEDLARDNPDQARSAIDKVQEVINERIGGKFSDLVEKGGDFVGAGLGLPDTTPTPAPTDPTDPTGPTQPPSQPPTDPQTPGQPPAPGDPQPPTQPVPDPTPDTQPAPEGPGGGAGDADPTTGTEETGPVQDGDVLGSDKEWTPGQ